VERALYSDRPLRRYSITLDRSAPVAPDQYQDYPPFISSPDGRDVLYPAQTETGRIWMVRTLTDLYALPIPGTENAQYFVPSPSGEWATFHRDGAYYRIPYVGGRGEKILDAPLSFGGIWEDESHVIFGSPERLFEDRYMLISSTPPGRWDIHPDGDQFLFVKPTIDQISNVTELVVIENWLEILRNPDRVGELR